MTTSNNTTVTNTTSSTQGTTMNTQLNAIASSLTSGTDIMDNSDIISQFLSGSNDLPKEVSQAFAASFAIAKDTNKVIQANRTNKALSLIVAHHMVETVGGKDTWLGDLVFTAAIEASYWWKNSPKEDKTTSHGKRIRIALNEVIGQDTIVSKKFDEALRFFKGYEIQKDENDVRSLVIVSINKQTKKREVEIVKELPKSNVQISLAPTGIKVGVKYNSTITPIKGQEFIFGRNVQQTYGTNIINEHLEDVLKSIRIHNEYEEMIDARTSDKTITQYREYAYKFNREDALVMLLLLKENNIDIKELFKFKREGGNKVLVLSRKEKNKGVKSLGRITVPAYTFKEKYGLSGVTSTNDAKMGFVVPMVSIPRMIEFNTIEDQQVVFLRESANKMASRFDKLNNSKAVWTRTIKLFVVADCTKHTLLNKALVGGNILVPDYILKSDGSCRVVNDMDLGGLKASYTPFAGLDNDLRKGDTCVIGVNGFKGGLLSAIGLVKGDINFVKNLSSLLDASKLMNVEKMPATLVEQMQHRSSTVLNYIYEEVQKNLSTMVINGEEVQGISVIVDIKVTNPYTLDTLQFTNEEDEEQTDGSKAINEAKERIENVVEEMETGVRPSTGIRAFIAEQKAGSADLFSVYEWMVEGLKDGSLKKKSLTTKIISQEIQSIAHWYGKDIAQNFLNELLEEQMEQGFSVNKLYAFQLLGFFERDTLNIINTTDIVNILFNTSKGIVEDSPVYSKETMREILDLISVYSNYGWLSVEFMNGTVEIPMGDVFLGDTLSQMDDETKPYVIAKGLLADLLEVIKTTVTVEGTPYDNSKHHLVMETFVQKPLLGKNFGYQFTKGFYGVALPLIGNYGVTTIAITNRSRMVKSDNTWEEMTFSKSPQYFKGMTATYNVMDYDLGHALNLVLESAIFVNPEMFIALLNDFDGDLGRLTKGKSLPFVELNYKEFNGNFFKTAYEGEVNGNMFKAKKAQQCSLEDYHKAIYDAVMAKDHVGSYTANSYFYEAMIPNLIGNNIFTSQGDAIMVTQEMAYQLNAILKMLIQLEAMDNMKQDGASSFITEMLLNYKLRGLDEKRLDNHLNETKKSLMLLVNNVKIDLTQEEVNNLVELAYATAITFTKELTTTFNLYGASNINNKALANVMDHINTDEELNTIYNFKNSYESILNGVDQESMYYDMIIKTGEALEACNFNIRAS